MKNNQVIAFVSGKGGTGKTSLATNFSNFMSQKEKVFLVDLDVEEPDSKLFFPKLNLQKSSKGQIEIPIIDDSKCDYCGLCAKKCNFNCLMVMNNNAKVFPEMCKSCYRCLDVCPNNAITFKKLDIGDVNTYNSVDNLNFKFLEGVLKNGDIHTKPLISIVKQHSYDVANGRIVYDCPPGTTCPMVESVVDADYIYIVVEPTIFGKNDFILTVETLNKLNKNYAVIINKSSENDKIIESYCKENNIEIVERIPFEKEVAEIISKGELASKINWYNDKLNKIYNHLEKKLENKNV